MFYIALNTGMRLSEILGLRWSRIDWKKQTIKVDAQLLVKRGKGTERRLGPTKNGKARTFKVAPAVMDTLKAVRQQQLERKLKAGPVWSNPLDLVFTNEAGNSIPHSTVGHRFTRIMQSLGLEHRFHDLRHTFACESIACGISPRRFQKRWAITPSRLRWIHTRTSSTQCRTKQRPGCQQRIMERVR